MGEEIFYCVGCGLVFTHPRPSWAELRKRYDESYYSYWITPLQHKRRVKLWRGRAKIIRQLKPEGRILDVGCGTGLFLHICEKMGYSSTGTEISAFAVKYCKKEYGISIENTSLEDSGFKPESFDMITFWHVLEHLPQPQKTLEKARDLLKPDGYLVIAVPNVESKIGHNFYRLLTGGYCPLYTADSKEPHLFHFSTKTLKLFLEKCGFRVIRATADFAQVNPRWKIIERIAFCASKLTGKDWYDSLLMIAKK
jgi:2-polyprenyl-3-methyl-5-hydroxy-6-metoxy-1,4-benzoquinol methylase